MNSDLTILSIKEDGTEHKLKRPIHPNLPDIAKGQLGLLISPVKTGKSTIITNLLLSKAFFAEQFDIVYIISNTIHNDRTSRFLKQNFPETCYSEYSDSIIQNIIQYQESFPKKKQPFIAVVLDDFLGIATAWRVTKAHLAGVGIFRAKPVRRVAFVDVWHHLLYYLCARFLGIDVPRAVHRCACTLLCADAKSVKLFGYTQINSFFEMVAHVIYP